MRVLGRAERQGWLHAHVTWVVTHLERPCASLMHCCRCVKMLNNCLTRALHFHFALDVANYVAGPGVRNRESLKHAQRAW